MDERLIYNQKKIPKEQWRYGFRTSAATGCGWIATYNALRILGYDAQPQPLIRLFERQFPLVHGNCGTSLWGPALYFKKRGFPVKCTAIRSEFDAVAKESDVCILFYWWRSEKKMGAHFVALQYTDAGFEGYNTFSNSTGPDLYGESLDAFMKKKKYFACFLTGIRKKPGERI